MLAIAEIRDPQMIIVESLILLGSLKYSNPARTKNTGYIEKKKKKASLSRFMESILIKITGWYATIE